MEENTEKIKVISVSTLNHLTEIDSPPLFIIPVPSLRLLLFRRLFPNRYALSLKSAINTKKRCIRDGRQARAGKINIYYI